MSVEILSRSRIVNSLRMIAYMPEYDNISDKLYDILGMTSCTIITKKSFNSEEASIGIFKGFSFRTTTEGYSWWCKVYGNMKAASESS